MDSILILQTFLDDMAKAVMEGDFPTYRRSTCLPFHLITHDSNIVVTTEEDLRQGFESFRSLLQTQRVTDYIRLVESVQRLDDTLITGRYVSHLIAGAMRVVPPFHSQITLRLSDDRWQAASITNALANSRWPVQVLSVPQTDPEKGPEQ